MKGKSMNYLKGLFKVVIVLVLFSLFVQAQNTVIRVYPYNQLMIGSDGSVTGGACAAYTDTTGVRYRECVEFDLYPYHTINVSGGQLISAKLNFSTVPHFGTDVGDVLSIYQLPSDLHIDTDDFDRGALVWIIYSTNNKNYVDADAVDVTSIVGDALSGSMPNAGPSFWGQGIQLRWQDDQNAPGSYGMNLSNIYLELTVAEANSCGDYVQVYPAGDLSGANGTPDGCVNFFDLDILISRWFECTNPAFPELCYPNTNTPEWLNNDLGKDDIVPAPWIPVTTQPASNQVHVWNRTYTFNDIGLCTSIMTDSSGPCPDLELLDSSAMKFVATINGDNATFTSTQFSITNTDTNAVVTAVSTSSPGNVTLTVKNTIEFDGFAKVDITLDQKPGVTLNQFWLEVPLKTANALYKGPAMTLEVDINSLGEKRPIIGTADWNENSPTYMTSTNLYWVGGDDIGFFLWAEDDRNWCSANRQEAQELIPTPASGYTVWRYRFVDPTVTRSMAYPLNLTYCYQATPMKPVADWYALRTSLGATDYNANVQSGYDCGVRQAVYHEPWSEIMGYPGTFLHQDQLQAYQDQFNARGMNLCLYTHPVISNAAPEFPYWGQKWSSNNLTEPFIRRNPKFHGMLIQDIYACNFDSSWADFIIYKWVHMIRDYNVNGAYLDGTHGAGVSVNPIPYYEPNGAPGKTQSIFAAREFMKRWYKACKAEDPNFFFFGHTSSSIGYAPGMSFLDMGTSGETESSCGRLENVEYPWSYWRAIHTGRQFGVINEFHKGPFCQEPYLAPLMLLHGGSVVTSWDFNSDVLKTCQQSVWDTWDNFGVSDAAWVPYWKATGNEITSSDPNVRVSYYTKPHQVLLVAATTKVTAQTAIIDINLPAFGIDPVNLKGWYWRQYELNGPDLMASGQIDVNGHLRLEYPGINEGGFGPLANVYGNSNYLWLASNVAFKDGFELGSVLVHWMTHYNGGGTSWTIDSNSHDGYGSALSGTNDANGLISNNIDLSAANTVKISFWYRTSNIGNKQVWLGLFKSDYSSYDDVLQLDTTIENQWNYAEFPVSRTNMSQYLFDVARLRFHSDTLAAGEKLWIDTVKVEVVD